VLELETLPTAWSQGDREPALKLETTAAREFAGDPGINLPQDVY
jgi:hypothetical protein